MISLQNHAVLKKLQAGQNSSIRTPGRPSVLSFEQEKNIADTCRHFSLRCVPLFREELAELVIFKGKRLPYRVLTQPDGNIKIESAAHLLPPGSIYGTRPEVDGIDTKIFVSCCIYFPDRVT